MKQLYWIIGFFLLAIAFVANATDELGPNDVVIYDQVQLGKFDIKTKKIEYMNGAEDVDVIAALVKSHVGCTGELQALKNPPKPVKPEVKKPSKSEKK